MDSSVVLARLFMEIRSPHESFWSRRLVSSRLLNYEVMNRVQVRAPATVLVDDAAGVLDRIEAIELTPAILARALLPFPMPVKTLDGLHLATMHYLHANGQTVRLASYDKRLIAAARAIGVESVADL